MFNFEDNIMLLVLKMIVSKMTPVCEGMFQILTSWNGVMGQNV